MPNFESLRPVSVNGQHTRLVRKNACYNPVLVRFDSRCACFDTPCPPPPISDCIFLFTHQECMIVRRMRMQTQVGRYSPVVSWFPSQVELRSESQRNSHHLLRSDTFWNDSLKFKGQIFQPQNKQRARVRLQWENILEKYRSKVLHAVD